MFYKIILPMIQIKNLKASAGEKQILKWVSLDFEIWKNYCLLWKNWSWKSTLSSVLMWSPEYNVDDGEIKIWWENLLSLSPEQRSKAGIFLSFQNIPEIPWIKISEYLRTIYNIHIKGTGTPDNGVPVPKEPPELSPFVFKRFIKKYLKELEIDEVFLDRDLNVWFSWGEKRKIEILQMKLIWPKYIILDEIDSGLDLDAFKTVAKLLQSINTVENSIIIITHYFNILDYINVDEVYVMENWLIKQKWWKELIDVIKEKGYN